MRITSGNLNTRVIKENLTEFNLVAQSFNQMSEALQQSNQDLTDYIEALKETQKELILWRQVFENAGWGVAVDDLRGETVLQMNEAYAKMHGYTIEELLNKPIGILYPPERHEFLRTVMQQTMETGYKTYETERLRKDGSTFIGHVELATITDKSGNITHRVANVVDITELRKAQEEINDIYQLTTVMLGTAGTDGYFKTLNPAWEMILGYTPEELMGKPFIEFVHPDDIDSTANEAAALADGESTVNFENRYLAKNGEYRLIQWNSLLRNGIIYFSAQDITKQREAEEALQAAKEAAEAANRAKTNFLSSMSHELRTPLNSILGFSQLLAANPTIDPSQHKQITSITRSGEHLLSIINDILEISRIESGQTELRTVQFDFFDMLIELQEIFSLPARDKRISLEFVYGEEVPRYLYGDVNKLRQILTNLLSNAIKFTHSGGITVRVTHKMPDPNLPRKVALYFEVEDTGAGISPDEVDKLFKPFSQTETGRSHTEGTGLGLTIVKHFVEIMDGEISVQSEVNKGTTFSFFINLTITNTMPQNMNAMLWVLAEDQPPQRILIVDDNPENRNVLRGLMQRVGFEIREASNGKEALDVWQEWEPHLIWMDIHMPEMDGSEATRHIRATEKDKRTAIIAITAAALDHDREQLIQQGFDDYIAKPFIHNELLQLMRNHLDLKIQPQDSTLDSNERQMLDRYIPQPSDLSEVPENVITSLKESALFGNLDAVNKAIMDIRSIHPDLASSLDSWTREYRLGDIMDFIEEWEQHSE